MHGRDLQLEDGGAMLRTVWVLRDDEIEDARMNILWGTTLGTLFMFAACIVAFTEGHFESTLSQEFQDATALEGKLFMVALIIPSLAYWVSGYYWKLANLRVAQHAALDWWCRFLRILCIISFSVVALIPHLAMYQENRENDEDSKAALAEYFARVHLVAGCSAFATFSVSELIVIAYNSVLSADEMWWRHLACAILMATMIMFELNKGYLMLPGSYSEHLVKGWSFRFEVMMATGFLWTNQICWHFSDPKVQVTTQEHGYRIAPWPHVASALIAAIDFYRCGSYMQASMCFVLEVAVFALVVVACWFAVARIRVTPASTAVVHGPHDWYGATVPGSKFRKGDYSAELRL